MCVTVHACPQPHMGAVHKKCLHKEKLMDVCPTTFNVFWCLWEKPGKSDKDL